MKPKCKSAGLKKTPPNLVAVMCAEPADKADRQLDRELYAACDPLLAGAVERQQRDIL